MGVRGSQQTRQLLKRHRTGAQVRQARLLQCALEQVCACAGCIEPDRHAAISLAMMLRISGEESLVVVRYAEISRVLEDAISAQLRRALERRRRWRHVYWTPVALYGDTFGWNSGFKQTPTLIFAEDFELVHAP